MTLLIAMMAIQPLFAQITTEDATTPPPAKAVNKKDKTKKEKEDKEDKEKLSSLSNLYIGGIPGFGINSYYVNVDAALEVGFFVHSHIALGVQTTYSYVLDKSYSSGDISYNVVRIGPYARGYIWKGIFAQAEYELTSIRNFVDHSDPNNVITYPVLNNNSLLLGAGYHENYKRGFGFYFCVSFNVLNSTNALSANPDFKVGLTYRFKEHYEKRVKKPKGGVKTTFPPMEREDEQ